MIIYPSIYVIIYQPIYLNYITYPSSLPSLFPSSASFHSSLLPFLDFLRSFVLSLDPSFLDYLPWLPSLNSFLSYFLNFLPCFLPWLPYFVSFLFPSFLDYLSWLPSFLTSLTFFLVSFLDFLRFFPPIAFILHLPLLPFFLALFIEFSSRFSSLSPLFLCPNYLFQLPTKVSRWTSWCLS